MDREAVADQLARFRAPDAALRRLDEPDDAERPALADHVAPIELFLALGTQWRRTGDGGQPVGLDYAAIRPTARLTGRRVTPGIMADLQVMEREVLAIVGRRAAAARRRR